ncbi:MAG: metallophosphoesterase family protein [Chloroflexota bacterium]
MTDLHGDWEAYRRYRDRFVDLQAKGSVDCLIFTGDLIHAEAGEVPDRSVDIVLDVLDLQARFGDAVIYLCGNHELPHIYGFGLGKGKQEYTAAFEEMMSQRNTRAAIIGLFMNLPFYLRTASGVSLSHAGAIPLESLQQALKLFNWDHQSVRRAAHKQLEESDKAGLRKAYARLSQAETYKDLAKQYLSVDDENDPRYDDLLVGFLVTMNRDFELLRSALFTRCEQEYGEEKYAEALSGLLGYLSFDSLPQRMLVTGHMAIRNRYQVVSGRQLRFASGRHAALPDERQYLLFDAGRPIESVEALSKGLHPISEQPSRRGQG